MIGRLFGYVALFGVLLLLNSCGGGGGGGDEATVTGGSVSEPAKEGVIFADDFERDEALAARYFEYVDGNGSFVRTAGAGVGGSYGMRAVWAPGQVDAGNIKLAFGRVPAGLGYPSLIKSGEDLREVYWRLYLRNEQGWTGNPDKLSRAISFGSESSWAEAMVAPVWSSNNSPVLVLDPASGVAGSALATTEYNDFANLHWLGAVFGTTPVFSAADSGKWFCIEAHVKLNTPGQSDGVFEMWIDNLPEASAHGLNWVGAWQSYGINSIFVENYWNDGAPAERIRYIDNFVVSTERIGCEVQ